MFWKFSLTAGNVGPKNTRTIKSVDLYYAWVQMLLQMGLLLRLGPKVITDGTFITLGSIYYTCAFYRPSCCIECINIFYYIRMISCMINTKNIYIPLNPSHMLPRQYCRALEFKLHNNVLRLGCSPRYISSGKSTKETCFLSWGVLKILP